MAMGYEYILKTSATMVFIRHILYVLLRYGSWRCQQLLQFRFSRFFSLTLVGHQLHRTPCRSQLHIVSLAIVPNNSLAGSLSTPSYMVLMWSRLQFSITISITVQTSPWTGSPSKTFKTWQNEPRRKISSSSGSSERSLMSTAHMVLTTLVGNRFWYNSRYSASSSLAWIFISSGLLPGCASSVIRYLETGAGRPQTKPVRQGLLLQRMKCLEIIMWQRHASVDDAGKISQL